jgi:hypothetical protein
MSLRPQGSLDRHLKHDTGRDMRQNREIESVLAIPPSFAWASQGLPELMVNSSNFCLYQREER